MESRTYAKANRHKSEQIAKDIAEFESRGGKIQVLPTKGDTVIGYVPVDPFNNRAKAAIKKRAAKALEDEQARQDEVLDMDDDDINPSRETPTEQLPIEAE